MTAVRAPWGRRFPCTPVPPPFPGGPVRLLTHGHRYGPHNPPPSGRPGPLSGHTHIPSWQWVGELFCANPGSVSLPRGGSPHSCLLYEDGLFRWLTLEGETFHWEVLPPPSKENILSD